MRGFGLPSGIVRMIGSAALCLAPSAAFAASVPVTHYINVNPIDVCSGSGTGCARINGQGQTSATNPGTTKIGFIDSGTGTTNTGIDVTRAILNEAGVDVVWGPVVQYNSAINPNTGTTYQTLNVIDTSVSNPCPFGTSTSTNTGFTSCDFLALSQQPAISRGSVPRTTTPKGVPVSANVTTINMFFVNKLVPPATQPGILRGFSWINNNGVAISDDTFLPPNGPVFETLGHELLHDLALTHTDFGAGSSSNEETAGAARTSPSSIGCAPVSTTNPDGGALFDLSTGLCVGGSPIAEQLTQTSLGATDCLTLISTSPVCTQQGAVSLSGFLNPIQTQTTTASPTSTCKKNCGATLASGPSPFDTINSSCNITFDVNYPGDNSGRPGEYLVELVLTPPPGFRLIESAFQPVTKGFVAKDHISNGQLIVQLNPPPSQFPPENTQNRSYVLEFIQTISSTDPTLPTPCSYNITALQGMEMGYLFSDGYFVTGAFDASLTASSTHPDPSVPAQIVTANFTGATQQPCTIPSPETTSTTSCPDPRQTGIEDGNPNEEALPP